MNAPRRLRTDNQTYAIALHNPTQHDCSWITPETQSEWRDREAKTEGRAEGEIEDGGTRRSGKGGLHRGWGGTQGRWQRATTACARPPILRPMRAVFACPRSHTKEIA